MYLAGISGYKGVKEFIMVQKYPSVIQDPDEPSPYSGVHLYGIIIGMTGMGGTAFGMGFAESIRRIKEAED